MLFAATGCAALAAAVWFGAFHVEAFQRADRELVTQALSLSGSVWEATARALVHLFTPALLIGLSLAVVAVALLRRDRAAAAAALLCVIAANAAAQLLQTVADAPRTHELLYMAGAPWPSGHAAAVVALAAATAIAVRDRRVALVAVALAALECLSVAVIHWHFPSDVLGGALIAAAIGFASFRLAGALAAWRLRRRPDPPLA